MSKLRRYRVPITGSGHTVIMQLDPDTAHQRYPNAVEVAVRAPGDTQTKTTAPAKRTRKAATKTSTPAGE